MPNITITIHNGRPRSHEPRRRSSSTPAVRYRRPPSAFPRYENHRRRSEEPEQRVERTVYRRVIRERSYDTSPRRGSVYERDRSRRAPLCMEDRPRPGLSYTNTPRHPLSSSRRPRLGPIYDDVRRRERIYRDPRNPETIYVGGESRGRRSGVSVNDTSIHEGSSRRGRGTDSVFGWIGEVMHSQAGAGAGVGRSHGALLRPSSRVCASSAGAIRSHVRADMLQFPAHERSGRYRDDLSRGLYGHQRVKLGEILEQWKDDRVAGRVAREAAARDFVERLDRARDDGRCRLGRLSCPGLANIVTTGYMSESTREMLGLVRAP